MIPLTATSHSVAPALPTWKFSLMLWVLGKGMPMEQRLHMVADAGYNAGEMTTEWRAWDGAERARIVKTLASLGLEFDLMFPSTVPLADPAQLAELEKQVRAALPVAEEIGCRQFSFRSGPHIAGMTPEAEDAAMVGALKRVSEICDGHNMDLVLEPIDRLEAPKEALNSALDGVRLIRQVGNPRLRVLYDFYHEQRERGNIISTLEANVKDVGIVHIADVPGRHRPGTGEMNYGNIYRALARAGYSRTVCMEFYPTGDPVAELKAARAEALAAAATA